MKKIVALLITIAMVLSMAAGLAVAEENKVLRVGASEDPNSINLFERLDGCGRAVWMPIYEALFDYDAGVAPYARLADTWELDEDGLGITIKIKQGINFHDGTEMKASDVLFSLKLGLESNWASAFGDINLDECKIVDDYTVYFAYNTVQGPLFYQLCYCYVMSEENYNAVQEGKEEAYVGTGAYKWKDWHFGMDYNMVRFDEYWGGAKYFDEISVRIVPDASVAILDLESGGLDMFQRPNASDAERILADENSEYVVWQGSMVKNMNLSFNLQADKMDNKALREAIVAAVNPEEVLMIAYAGLGSVATCAVPHGISSWEAYGENGVQYNYDPEVAKAKLVEAGYPDGVTIPLYYINTSDQQKVAEVIIGQLSRVGINVEAHSNESSALMDLQMQTNETAMFLRLFNYSGDPNQVINIAWDPAVGTLGTQNYFRNENEACREDFIKINDEAKITQDMDERNVMYRQLFNMLIDNVWSYAMVDYGENFAMRKDIKGFWTGGVAFHYEDAYIEE